MPLKDQKPTALGNYIGQKQRERNQQDPTNRSSTPLHNYNENRARRDSNTSSNSNASNPLGAKDALPMEKDYSRALAMKLAVPDTMGNSRNLVEKSVNTIGTEYEPNFHRPKPQSKTQKSAVENLSTFDDTTSLSHEDDTSLYDNENRTVVFRGGQESITNPPAERQPVRYSSTFDNTAPIPNSAQLDENWQEMSAKGQSMFQKEASKHATYQRTSFVGSRVNQPVRKSMEHHDTDSTPSRTQVTLPNQFPKSLLGNKTVSFESSAPKNKNAAREDSPDLEIPRSNIPERPVLNTQGSTQATSQPDLSKSSRLVLPDNVSTSHAQFNDIRADLPHREMPPSTFESSRASDYPTSSEDEIPPAQSRFSTPPPTESQSQSLGKRQREEELDYDPVKLKSMKYEDLNNQDFCHDPRAASDVAYDSHGNAMALSQRLKNLNKMSEDEQKTMFRSQNDEEWASMGSWFIEKFQEDLQKLMDIRFERRKISMKYENEIHRRQKEVDWSSAGIDAELRELKKGGGELIKGRDPPSRRGTPQRK